MKVLNLDTGKIEERIDPFECRREELEQQHAFTIDGVRFAGYCVVCNRPVLWEDRAIDINRICGNVRVDVNHRRCL